jgi:hypothetical protein
MRRKKSVLSRVTLALGLGIAASSAHAVPIVFDFTGTVSYTVNILNGQNIEDFSLAGQTVVGRLTFETDGLVARTGTISMGSYSAHLDVSGGPDLITNELSIGGVRYDVDFYPDRYGQVAAFDSSDVEQVPCPGLICSVLPDTVSIMDWSTQYLSAAPGSDYFERGLSLMWSGSTTSDPLGLVDLSVPFDPSMLPSVVAGILPIFGDYEQTTWSCPVDGGDCTNTALTSTLFSIDSLTIHTPSVPEPGTLALFGIGLLGGAVTRRSAVKAR